MSGDLVEFIEARLADDMALALLASPGPWHLNAEHDEVVAVDDISVAEVFALSSNQLRNTAAFIADHDPTRVLREVEAKRRLLAFLLDIEGRELGGEWWQINQRHAAPIQMLAVAWSVHPDYRAEWAPA